MEFDLLPVLRFTACHWLVMCVALVAAGCGKSAEERVPVKGHVLIDGQSLSSGTIRLVPETGRPASSAIMADGSFELASESVDRVSAAGVPPGSYRVQVSASQIIDDATIRWNAPEKYADFRTSGLEVKIDKATDDLVIELQSEAEPPTEKAPDGSTPDEAGPDAPVEADAGASESNESEPTSAEESPQP